MVHLVGRFSIFSSIRSKLITLLLVLAGFPLLIIGFLAYQSAADSLLKQTTMQLGNLAQKTAQQIDNFFQSAEKDINLLSDYPFVQLSFLQHEFRQRLETVQRLLNDYMQKNDSYDNIYLIGMDGRPILSVPHGMLQQKSFYQTDWFQKTLQQGIYLSDVNSSIEKGQKGIFLGKLVYDFQNAAKPVGVLAFHIRPSAYNRFVQTLSVGGGGYSFLLQQNGAFIYHPDSIQSASQLLAGGDSRYSILLEKMTKGRKGYGHYSLSGQEKFLVFTPCRKRSWSVGITVLRNDLMADINHFQRKLITFFAVIILLTLPVSYLFIRNIMRPINQLINGAKRIAGGELNQSIVIRSNDELRAVADEFNTMAVRLEDSMNDIIDLKNFNEDILRNITSGIITVDREGQLSSFNAGAARILDYEPLAFNDYLPWPVPDAFKETLADLKNTLATGQGVGHKELTIVRKDRETAYVEIQTSLLASKTGKIFGAIADIRDITQRKRMEEVMLRVEKLASLGELSAGMAHEIRNPLAGIKTSVQVLAKRVSKPASKELLRGIESEINRLDKIVGDLLRFSRPAPSRPEPLEIKRIVRQITDLLNEKLKAHAIAVEKQFYLKDCLAVVDQEQIRQILINLILNSIKAMESGGRLTIFVSPANAGANGWSHTHGFNESDLWRYIKVAFEDTGVGIAPEHLKRIFDPFFTTDPKGTGLGLSIVHKLVEENHGRIFIDSIPGERTRVILLLPAEHREEG